MARRHSSKALSNHIRGMLPSIPQVRHTYRCKVGVEVMHSEGIDDRLPTRIRTCPPLPTLLRFSKTPKALTRPITIHHCYKRNKTHLDIKMSCQLASSPSPNRRHPTSVPLTAPIYPHHWRHSKPCRHLPTLITLFCQPVSVDRWVINSTARKVWRSSLVQVRIHSLG